MATFKNIAQSLLKEHNYLHYKDIVEEGLKKGILETDGKTPEDTMSAVFSSDISKKGIKSTFIRVGGGTFSLRSKKDEDNLLSFLNYRLKDEGLWIINDKDEKYLFTIFGVDILSDGKIKLNELLQKLKDSEKIIDYKDIGENTFVTLNNKSGEFKFSKELENSLENLKKDSEKIKGMAESIRNNSGITELSKQSAKITQDLKNILPQIIPGGLLAPNNETLAGINKLDETLKGLFKNNIVKDFIPMVSGLQETLKMYDTKGLSKLQLEEYNNVVKQINAISTIFSNPAEGFSGLFLDQSDGLIVNKKEGVEKSKGVKGDWTHSFEGSYNDGDFKTIRGFAPIQELSKISEAVYQPDGGVQRNEDTQRCLKIQKYIETGSKRFIPEVVIGLYVKSNGAITNGTDGKGKYSLEEGNIFINFELLEKGQITRIDGNHRLFHGENVKGTFNIPFCFVIFDETQKMDGLSNIYKNQEANIFYLLNGKNVPVSSEDALNVILNMPKEEAEGLYQNDSTLGLTRLCKEKYDKYCSLPGGEFKYNFGNSPFTKFENLIKEVEKLGLNNNNIDNLLNIIFETIHPLGSKYKKIIGREDFLYLVLTSVLGNKDKECSERNKIIIDFFDWILVEGLEGISFSKKPILWELYNKGKSFKQSGSIHEYQINESIRNGESDENSFKEFIAYINDSRLKIKDLNINEKKNGLEKIVDAYSKLLDIVGSGKTDNALRIDKFIGKNFHSSNKENMKKYLKYDLYDNLGKRVMNNDFAIRHHETDKESLEDIQFIEFLYCEYDNAIKFILNKEGYLIR